MCSIVVYTSPTWSSAFHPGGPGSIPGVGTRLPIRWPSGMERLLLDR